jgi:hypothetical protein
MRTVIIVVVLLVVGTTGSARAEHRCIGWGIGGGFAGMVAGSWTVRGAFAVAGEHFGTADHKTRDDVLLGSGAFVGGVAGSIGACSVFDNERHAVPIATFVMGGTALGAIAGLTGASAANESDVAIAMTFAGGMVAGAIGGYFLHRGVFGVHADDTYVAPVASSGTTGLAIGGRF